MEFSDPDWSKSGSKIPHDWHSYVSDEVRSLWNTFTEAQKEGLAKCFDEIASNEEWE